jgi:uncharacterized membrane protein YdbT with pleckstrin-like domain
MSPTNLFHAVRAGSVERYLIPGEQTRYVTRRHVTVFARAAAAWVATLALYLSEISGSEQPRGLPLAEVGLAILAGASLILVRTGLRWATTRYVFTTERILVIQGVLTRRVDGIRLQLVTDIRRRESLAGRLIGYGHLDLRLSGRPVPCTLAWLPDLHKAYKALLVLKESHAPEEPEWEADEAREHGLDRESVRPIRPPLRRCS